MKWSNLLFLGGGGVLLWYLYDKERKHRLRAENTRKRLMGDPAATDPNSGLSTPGLIPGARAPVKHKSWDESTFRPWVISSAIYVDAEGAHTQESPWRRYRNDKAFTTSWIAGMKDWFEGDAFFPQTWPISTHYLRIASLLTGATWDTQNWANAAAGERTLPPNMVVLQPASQGSFIYDPASQTYEGEGDDFVDREIQEIASVVGKILNNNMVVVLVGPYPYGNAANWGIEHHLWWNRLEAGMRAIAEHPQVYYVDVASEFGDGAGGFEKDDMLDAPNIVMTGPNNVVVAPAWDLAEEIGMSIGQVMQRAAEENGMLAPKQSGAVS